MSRSAVSLRVVLILLVPLCAPAIAGAANLLSNPGFEQNTGNGTDPVGWIADFNSYGAFAGAARTGGWGLHPGAAASAGGRYQDLAEPLVAGRTYEARLWVQNFDGATGSSHVRVLVGRAGADPISVADVGPRGGHPRATSHFSAQGAVNRLVPTRRDGSWSEVAFEFTARGGENRLGIYNAHLADDTVHSVNVDDVVLWDVARRDAALQEAARWEAVFREEVHRLPPIAFIVQQRLGNPDGVVRYHSRPVVERWGCKIQVLERGGPPRTIYANPRAAIFDMNSSFDAKTLFFSMREGYDDNWSIYEIGVDGSGFRRISDGQFHDFAPSELPDGGLVFVSTRIKSFNMCAWDTATALFTMDRDGANIRQLTVNTLNEFLPQTMPDGRILYTRWEYVDRDVKWRQSLWTVNSDGTMVQLYFGNTVRNPGVMWQARPIPGTAAIVATLAPHHGWVMGAVGTVTRAHGTESPAGLKWITREFPDIYDNWQPLEWAYRDPYPLCAERFLVSYGGGRESADRRFKVYLLTADDRRTLVWDDGALSCTYPIPLVPRERPPARAGHEWPEGVTSGSFLVQNVYEGLGSEVAPGEIKWLRVMEQIPKYPVNETGEGRYRVYEMNPVMGQRNYYARRTLGRVPVERDGSVHFTAPALRELYFQALDAEGRAVQSMGSAVNLVPGERQTCIGCHERRTLPPPPRMTLAASRPPVEPEPYPWGNEGRIEFHELVQPVLDRHCAECHSGANPAGRLNLSGDKTRFFNMAYDSIFARGLVHTIRLTANDSQVIPPKQAFTFASRLRDYIEGRADGHEDVGLSPEQRQRVYLWMDTNSGYYGRYERTRPETPGDRDLWAGAWFHERFLGTFNEHCRSCHADFGRKQFPDDSHWINLTHPEQSMVLAAHLAESAGGWELSRPVDGQSPPRFEVPDDPVLRSLRAAIEQGRRDMLAAPRIDMPGAVPLRGPSDWGQWRGTGPPAMNAPGNFWESVLPDGNGGMAEP
ncbi:MAG: hypothetical protein KJ000_32365 [Pirellulaceae bacterium]|nr:hypothetical protein [Pirellulaceae bacterium]